MTRNFWLLYADQLISSFATNSGTFAMSWFVYQITNSPTAMSTLWFVTIIAQMTSQFVIGPYLDRISRRRVMMISEIVRLVAFGLIAVMYFAHSLHPGTLYVGALVASMVMYGPAANALVPATVPGHQLVKANARVISSVQLVQFLSYPIAGFCIGSLGTGVAISLPVFLYLISILIIRSIKEDRVVAGKTSWWIQFKKGTAIYRQKPILLVLGLFIAVINFGVTATQSMYLPYVKKVLEGTSFEYGVFAGCFPLGYFVGAMLVSRLGSRSHSLYYMFGALLYGGLTYLLLSLTTNAYVALLIEVSSGIIMPFWGVNSTTLYQRIVPSDIRAQVFAVRTLIAQCATPLGAIYAAFAVERVNIPFLFGSVGTLCVTTGTFGVVLASRGYLTVRLESYSEQVLQA